MVDFSHAWQSFDLQSFYNTVLGKVYDDQDTAVEANELEQLKTDVSIENIPDDVIFLCSGIDQQLDRAESTILGVAKDKVYILDHRSFTIITVNDTNHLYGIVWLTSRKPNSITLMVNVYQCSPASSIHQTVDSLKPDTVFAVSGRTYTLLKVVHLVMLQ